MRAAAITHINAKFRASSGLSSQDPVPLDTAALEVTGQAKPSASGNRRCYIWNAEEPDLRTVQRECKDKAHVHVVADGVSKRTMWVLVLRDPFNLMASRHGHANAGAPERRGWTAVEIWQHAQEEALGVSNHLGGREDDEGFLESV